MLFGLKNACASFVRAVRSLLRPIRSFADSYVDDIGVGSKNWGAHLANFCRSSGVTANYYPLTEVTSWVRTG